MQIPGSLDFGFGSCGPVVEGHFCICDVLSEKFSQIHATLSQWINEFLTLNTALV